jgi:hypothetical protein
MGKTVLVATHSDQADRWANRHLHLKDGCLQVEPCGA